MSTERIDIPNTYPIAPTESDDAWTNRLLLMAKLHGTYRQCSIGWHDECSQRHLGAEAECNCLCHEPGVSTYSVEGHVEGGTAVVTRVEVGKHFWPPKDGDPESTWAHWILASSMEDASAKGKAAEEARL